MGKRLRRRRPPAPTNKSWEAFVEWCRSRGLRAVPANPWTVAAYARYLEPRHRPATIRKRIVELARIHEDKTRKRLVHHPTVERTLKMIERRADAEKRDAGLFTEGDFLADGKPKRQRPARTSSEPEGKSPQAASKRTRPGLRGQPRLVSRRTLDR